MKQLGVSKNLKEGILCDGVFGATVMVKVADPTELIERGLGLVVMVTATTDDDKQPTRVANARDKKRDKCLRKCS